MANQKTKRMTLLAMFLALEVILAFVPNLGFIQTGTIQITTMHIPVIICGILLGTSAGAFTGFVFGAASFINATFLTVNPIVSPLFTPFYSNAAFESNWLSLVICFVPRILVGVVAALAYNGLSRVMHSKSVSMFIAAIAGSVTNTVLVLGGAYLFFGEQYSQAAGISMLDILAGIISINGLLEAVVAGILTVAIAVPCMKVLSER